MRFILLFPVLATLNNIECSVKRIIRTNSVVATDNAKGVVHDSEAHDIAGSVWPKAEVPFYIDSYVYDFLVSRKLRQAMNQIEAVSCVQFVPLSAKPNGTQRWLHFTNPSDERACTHGARPTGNGEIVLVLGYDCLQSFQILHSLMHGLGLPDEVTRAIRYAHVRILWTNIQPEYRHLFRLSASVEGINVVEYDSRSVMGFHPYAFSKNGRPTIVPLHPGMVIQASSKLTHLDEMKLRLFFKKECLKRDVGNLLETCKDTLHAANPDGHHLPASTTSFEDIGWTTKDGHHLPASTTSFEDIGWTTKDGTHLPASTTSIEDIGWTTKDGTHLPASTTSFEDIGWTTKDGHHRPALTTSFEDIGWTTKDGHHRPALTTSFEDIGWTTKDGHHRPALTTSFEDIGWTTKDGTHLPASTTSDLDVSWNKSESFPDAESQDEIVRKRGVKKRRRLWRRVSKKRS